MTQEGKEPDLDLPDFFFGFPDSTLQSIGYLQESKMNLSARIVRSINVRLEHSLQTLEGVEDLCVHVNQFLTATAPR
jgi:hypothetical protein